MKATIFLQISLASVLMLASAPRLSLSAETLQEVKIGYTSTSISAFPIEFARRKGFFRAEGLNVLMIVMRTNIIMNALLTRGIDYGTPTTSVIRAAANDLPVKAVAVLTGRPDYFLVAKKEFKSLQDLKGKRIAIGTFGAAADIALRVVLRQEGLDPERDVIRLQLGGGDSRFAALVGGTVDATILNFPFNLQGGKIGLQRPALARGAIGDASVDWGSEMKRFKRIPGRFLDWSGRFIARCLSRRLIRKRPYRPSWNGREWTGNWRPKAMS